MVSVRRVIAVLAAVLFMLLVAQRAAVAGPQGPSALAVSADGKRLFVANADAGLVAVVDVGAGRVVATVNMPARPSGLTLCPNGRVLYVTCAAPRSQVVALDTTTNAPLWQSAAGHTATSPIVTPDGNRVYVCNRFDNDVSVIDTSTGKTLARVSVTREPVAAAVTPDGRTLVVANHLPLVPSIAPVVSAVVTLIDTKTLETVAVALPGGSTSLKDICVTPDGRYALVTHILGNSDLVASHLDLGWMNTNSITVVDLAEQRFAGNFLLDDLEQGAANAWGIATTTNGATICVAHSGTHELSLIDTAAIMSRPWREWETRGPMGDPSPVTNCRRRIKLPGRGPRQLVVAGSRLYVAEYFSDTVAVVELVRVARTSSVSGDSDAGSKGRKTRYRDPSRDPDPAKADAPPATIRLGPAPDISLVRRGEMLFHDASYCYQRWQSCASCHPDGRADGLNWDLLNDGFGNPKNTKSMLLAHRTPPAMVSGVRGTAELAVRAGMEHILFADPNEEKAVAVDAYLKSLRPAPSPQLVHGRLSAAAERGRLLFESRQVGCALCHPPPLYTDLKPHKVDPPGSRERRLDTPTLIEVWRTAPYPHNGQFTTVEDLLVRGRHGRSRGGVEQLSDREIKDLVEFVLSL